MGEYADMSLIARLERHNRRQLAKGIAVLTGYAPSVVYLVLIGSEDDLPVTRQALEHAMATNTYPEPARVDRASCRWEPTLSWELVRLEAQARAFVLQSIKRLLEKRHG